MPADTFVLFGAFLAAAGRSDPWLVFLSTWLANIASAFGVYFLARRHGKSFFSKGIGHWLVHPRQMAQIEQFYKRWGVPAIFLSRFLPGLRAMVPVFAGVTHVPFGRLAVPLATASGIWYGVLVYIGTTAGRNWDQIVSAFERYSRIGLWVAVPLLVLIGWWWWHSRRDANP